MLMETFSFVHVHTFVTFYFFVSFLSSANASDSMAFCFCDIISYELRLVFLAPLVERKTFVSTGRVFEMRSFSLCNMES